MSYNAILYSQLLLLITFPLSACLARETTVKDINQLVGFWGAETPSGMISILDIHADGTMVTAGGWDRYDSGLTDTWNLWIEDELVYFQGPLFCADEIGLYEASIGSDAVLRFSVVEDPCSFRRRVLDKSEPGNLEQYDLEYSRIEG